MSEKVLQFPKTPSMNRATKLDITIEKVLDEFVAEYPGAEKAKADCAHAIDLFKHYLNDYAYQCLSPEEKQTFEHYYNLKGNNHKSFCQLFEPEKITVNVSAFVSYFLVKKVMASPAFIGKAAAVAEKLCRWLVTKGYVDADDISHAAPRASQAAKQLPPAQKAGDLLWKECMGGTIFNSELPDESGYMYVARVEAGKFWLRSIAGTEFGPIKVSTKITDLLEVDWEINCALKKSGKSWRIVEVGCVYPH